jgi:hypothetical protein
MAVDHLPSSGAELEDLVEHPDTGGDDANSAGNMPAAEPARKPADDEESWPQTGFGSFP